MHFLCCCCFIFPPQEWNGGSHWQQNPHNERSGVWNQDHQDVRLGKTIRCSGLWGQKVKHESALVLHFTDIFDNIEKKIDLFWLYYGWFLSDVSGNRQKTDGETRDQICSFATQSRSDISFRSINLFRPVFYLPWMDAPILTGPVYGICLPDCSCIIVC